MQILYFVQILHFVQMHRETSVCSDDCHYGILSNVSEDAQYVGAMNTHKITHKHNFTNTHKDKCTYKNTHIEKHRIARHTVTALHSGASLCDHVIQ